MATVIINGKTYDAQTGLQINQDSKNSQPKNSVRKKRISKQERMAAEISREFAELEQSKPSEPFAKSNSSVEKSIMPNWISDYVSSASTSTPNWISNYILGNDPIEIEPIELNKIATEEKTKWKFTTSRQNPNHINRTPNRATTLNRTFTKKPHSSSLKVKFAVARHEISELNIEKHPSIQRFAQAQIKVRVSPTPKTTDEKLAPAFKPNLASNASRPTGDEIRRVLNSEMLNASHSQKSNRFTEKVKAKRFFRAPTLITAALAFVILGGYFTYINIPTISIRIAANQAGINAHVPSTPNGYSIDGPVAHASGQIRINYRSNGGADGFSITQQESSWVNADIVRYLLPSHEDHRMLDVNGMTIYRFGNNAIWIKDNILFTVNGNDLTSDEKIIRIAESIQS